MKGGIRRRLMMSFFLTSGIICVVMLFIVVTITDIVNSVADSYDSNNSLKEFNSKMVSTEDALEAYMNLKTYETIDRYYSNREKLERMTLGFNKKACDNEILMMEYTVSKFTESFLGYADLAVYEKRAGNNLKSYSYYREALNAYSLLSDSVISLNELYFDENLIRYNEMRIFVRQITNFSLIIIAMVIFFNILLVYYLVSKITQPLVEISNVANSLAERNFDIPLFSYKKDDEVGNICRAFNRMILSIREYIDTIWENAIAENELREKELKMNELYQEAKLTALQSQINPHFLFNTLNTGAQLAMLEGSDRTCGFLEQVADFYRYNLQFTGQDARLEDEIKMVETYVYIMKVRFGEKFDFETDIRYSDLNLRIPGMILQPLVENCIKHGLRNVSKGGKIVLSIYEDSSDGKNKCVTIAVKDNGCGFPADKRDALLNNEYTTMTDSMIEYKDDSSSGTGVGLVNVISRLRMFYKDNYVFDIGNNDNIGTSFIIKVKNV